LKAGEFNGDTVLCQRRPRFLFHLTHKYHLLMFNNCPLVTNPFQGLIKRGFNVLILQNIMVVGDVSKLSPEMMWLTGHKTYNTDN
jgi:hypothetical protein